MKQTEKVSVGGFPFTLERDAYERLNGYIEDVRSTYEKNSYAAEIMSDIEQRIAELFIEKGGKNSVVSYAMVDDVIMRIGSPAELAGEEQAGAGMQDGCSRRQERRYARPDGPKRLYRDTDNRILGGVCSGIAAYFRIDTVLVRLLFAGIYLLSALIASDHYDGFAVAMAVLSPVAIAAYALMWIIIPPAKTVEEKCRMRGEPIDLKQFTQKFEKLPVREAINEARTSPALHTAGRVISIIVGIILITTGIANLIGCTAYDLVRNLIEKELDLGHLGYYNEEQIFFSQFFLREEFWWLCVAVIGLFAVWLIYNGVLLTFNLHSPRWRPGTIIFILWIVSLLVLAAWVIRRLLIIGTLM